MFCSFHCSITDHFITGEKIMTKTMNLQGVWDFQLDTGCTGIHEAFYTKNFDDTISLPGTTSMAQKGTFSDKMETGTLTDPYLYEGYAWYSKEIHLEPEDVGREILLYLERTRVTMVWVNDIQIGTYDSLNTPHIYNLTKAVTGQDFRLTILVANLQKPEEGDADPLAYPTKGGHLTSPDTQTNWNGIIGEISLRIHEACYISHIKTLPDTKTGTVTLEMTTVNASGSHAFHTIEIHSQLRDRDGLKDQITPVQSFEIPFPAGEAVYSVTYDLGEHPVLWSEYTPVIYELTVSFADSTETVTTTFGLRDFTTEGHDFLINGRKTFLRGKHDGLIFPLTGAVPATVGEWIKVLSISKSYGINHYRFHTCCPPDAAFTAADLVGIYMEPQLPFWGTMTAPGEEGHNETEQSYLIEEGYRMMKYFGNHASYCMMSLGNELWGSKERISEILAAYKAVDTRHLYTQGSNNFQHTPVILPEEDFFVGVRLSKNRLFRGSYGMCDAPLGHIQSAEPATRKNYDEAILPSKAAADSGDEAAEIEIQYGTGVKKVKAAENTEVLMPEIPVVSHEIGQYCVFPNFHEIDKYTGVLKARNFEVFRDRLEEKGMLDQADDFFYNSGKLAVQCYKEELEAAARTKNLAGYQILDIQDFSGQGTALVGILDAFMDSKGLVTTKEWAGYCSDAILMAEFDSYVLTAGSVFEFSTAFRYYRPESLAGKSVTYRFTLQDGTKAAVGTIPLPSDILGLVKLEDISIPVPAINDATTAVLSLFIEGTGISNEYELYLYPADNDHLDLANVASVGEGAEKTYITNDFDQAEAMLTEGKRVLYLPKETVESLKGFYCTEFWCYPMFRDICEWMKKPVAVGTMGLLIQNEHPALKQFPSHTYATPQWYQLVSHCDCAILDDTTDKSYRPIIQMMDNFDRNHKLGILFEGQVGTGSLMVCTIRLSELVNLTEPTRDDAITAAGEIISHRDVTHLPEVDQFIKSLISYVSSDAFRPEQTLDMKKLRKTFVGE